MYNLVLPYLLGTAFSVAVVVMALAAYALFRSKAAMYEHLSRKLPDACRYEDLHARVEDLEKERDRVQDELFSARQIIAERAEAEEWLRNNREELLSLEAERAQQEHLRAELMGLQNQLGEEKDRQLRLAKELQAMEVQCDALKEKRDELQATIEAANAKSEQLANEATNLKKTKAALESECAGLESQLSAQKAQLEDAKASLERRLRAIDQELAEATTNRDRLLAEVEKACADAEEKRTRTIQGCREDEETALRDHAAKVAELKKELAALRESMFEERKDLEATHDRTVQARQELATAKAELAGLEQACRRQGIELQEIRKKTDQDKIADSKRTSELWQPVFKRNDHEPERTVDELKQLDIVRNHLESHGLMFSDRVVKAFHTSLKVSDISPLVVLAGISGTGKSELPRRYAEAMNMHFLNMAVQPRWDSPQDMFGFFNYLEGRFRSTPLGRALIQMDPYHGTNGRGWNAPQGWADENSLSDQMMLVLLDEMNLARIEYYFSEFLSRLETRRGIDNLSNDEDRRKAAIALDIGSSSDGNAMMQLFVGTNVLFVGTMNEDETTQTLSDKVVDRANVLRFGRPRNLRFDGGSNGKQQGAAKGPLAHEEWRSWCEGELSGKDSKKVDEWIARLNEAMTAIRRPFAHRTNLAIRSYVANYPGLGQDADALRHAMSDQLEQKIFPKFRGLDPTEPSVRKALDAVQKVLDELEDKQLISAINESRREHVFIWMGVDRFEQEAQA